MRAIGTALWVSAALFELGACGPRISVGDLGVGGTADAAGSGGSSGSVDGSSGSKVTGGGGTETSKAGGADMPAGGETALAGGGGSATGCPSGLTTALPPVPVECPDTPPSSGDACTVPENSNCVWQTGIVGKGGAGYEVRGCYSGLGGNEWYGLSLDQGSLGPTGVDPQHCPHAVPEAGSSCSGHAGENCYFPQAACACADEAANWSCTENRKPNLVPAPVERLCAPDGVDEARAINDLSSGEIDAWCQWYGGGGPRPDPTGRDAPGYASTYSTSWGHIGAEVCLMDLPFDLCKSNMLLHQSCTATLGQLDDCVESIRAWPTGGWVGHGCGPLLSNTSCARLIVQQVPSGMAGDCEVPVAAGAD